MQDWEHFNHSRRSRGVSDDPWDRKPASSVDVFGARRPESHDPGPDHVIGSCGPDLTYDSHCVPRKKHGTLRGVVIILVAALVIFGVGIGITRLLMLQDAPASGMSCLLYTSRCV